MTLSLKIQTYTAMVIDWDKNIPVTTSTTLPYVGLGDFCNYNLQNILVSYYLLQRNIYIILLFGASDSLVYW